VDRDADIVRLVPGGERKILPGRPAGRRPAVGCGVVLSRARSRGLELAQHGPTDGAVAFDQQADRLAAEFRRDGLTRETIVTIALLAEGLRRYSATEGGEQDGSDTTR
jgi:hypothetical protein